MHLEKIYSYLAEIPSMPHLSLFRDGSPQNAQGKLHFRSFSRGLMGGTLSCLGNWDLSVAAF